MFLTFIQAVTLFAYSPTSSFVFLLSTLGRNLGIVEWRKLFISQEQPLSIPLILLLNKLYSMLPSGQGRYISMLKSGQLF